MRIEPPPDSSRANAETVHRLTDSVARCATAEAAEMLAEHRDDEVARTLEAGNPSQAVSILWDLPESRRAEVLKKASPLWAKQWAANHAYPESTIGRLMAPAFAEFPPSMTVRDAVEKLRDIVKQALVSYAFIVDGERRLLGALVFRDMMLARPDQTLSKMMIRDPFHLKANTPIADAMKQVLRWHHPSYPICDDSGRLVGVVRGQTLFQQQAFELSAQPGSMVGVEKDERLATPWLTSLRYRHPWLQLNLLTAFLAAAVVGVFEGTLDRIVALAVFLPVVAGQSGNTGSQALAVTLRGMTLGELQEGQTSELILKEAWLGLLNGALVGIVAGLGMLLYASSENVASAGTLAFVVGAALTVACVASGIAGVIVPITLRKMGADPATASSIFLSTATDCASMGLFLGLAALLIP